MTTRGEQLGDAVSGERGPAASIRRRARLAVAGAALALRLHGITPAMAAEPAMHGVAAAKAIVQAGDARFTVLTPQVIRMEWSPQRNFVDSPSQVFVDREQPVPAFTSRTANGRLVIETAALRLSYTIGSGRFTAANLQVASKALAPAFTWHPGDAETGNLGGTARTVDQYSGDVQIVTGKHLDLGPGLLSRDGWHVVDDSRSFLFDDSAWAWVKPRACADCQDLYFFGYGHDYKSALGDYARIAGREPMPPRYALGYWWSRYWNYSDAELRALAADFDRYRIPLDVLVIDMDWHRTDGLSWDARYSKTDQFGQSVGWTGYSWNRSLLPEPGRLLDWLHGQGLKTTVNLHPASGIAAREDSYPAFAKAMNVRDGAPIPFEAADKRFIDEYFKITLDPLKAQGIDFWWLDWQQWPDSKLVPGLSNTWWLNYVFFTHMQRTDEHRALIYHRWGGLGNHRYQIGFSGDSVISWPTLAFQPYFTSTASNVLYGYWSHDIGGHFFPDSVPPEQRHIDPELYVRWMQFGAYSPILRTHSSKEADLRKEPWRFSPDVFAALRQTIELRYQLIPYIYTAARQAYDSGVSILRPLYYAWPEQAQAYAAGDEYMFGDDMLVAPVTSPAKDDRSVRSIWLPPGRWFDQNRGAVIEGGRTLAGDYALDETPVFVRAGAAIPLNPSTVRKAQDMDNAALALRIVPGGTSRTRIYTDGGDSEAYRRGEGAFTAVESRRDAGGAHVVVRPREGRYPGMPERVQFTIELPASSYPAAVTVDGVAYRRSDAAEPGHWHYDGDTLTARIVVPAHAADRSLTVDVAYPARPAAVDGLLYRMKRVAAAVAWLKDHWEPPVPLPDDLSLAAQLGRLIDYHPEHLPELVAQFERRVPMLVQEIDATHAKPEVKARFRAMMAAATV